MRCAVLCCAGRSDGVARVVPAARVGELAGAELCREVWAAFGRVERPQAPRTRRVERHGRRARVLSNASDARSAHERATFAPPRRSRPTLLAVRPAHAEPRALHRRCAACAHVLLEAGTRFDIHTYYWVGLSSLLLNETMLALLLYLCSYYSYSIANFTTTTRWFKKKPEILTNIFSRILLQKLFKNFSLLNNKENFKHCTMYLTQIPVIRI